MSNLAVVYSWSGAGWGVLREIGSQIARWWAAEFDFSLPGCSSMGHGCQHARSALPAKKKDLQDLEKSLGRAN